MIRNPYASQAAVDTANFYKYAHDYIRSNKRRHTALLLGPIILLGSLLTCLLLLFGQGNATAIVALFTLAGVIGLLANERFDKAVEAARHRAYLADVHSPSKDVAALSQAILELPKGLATLVEPAWLELLANREQREKSFDMFLNQVYDEVYALGLSSLQSLVENAQKHLMATEIEGKLLLQKHAAIINLSAVMQDFNPTKDA